MNVSINLSYKWWSNTSKNIKPKHLEQLKEQATVRIVEQYSQGITSGELHHDIDNRSYSGWYEVKTC